MTKASPNPPRHCGAEVGFSLFFLSTVSIVLAGCGTGPEEKLEIREENYAIIEIGATRNELETRFGPGSEMPRADAIQLFGELEKERFDLPDGNRDAPKAMKWTSNGFSILVLFVDDKVVAKGMSGKLQGSADQLQIGNTK